MIDAPPISALAAYKLRLKRRRYLWRSFRSRHQLQRVHDRTDSLTDRTVIAVTTLRNEILRLPYFLKFYRARGIGHFLIVDNGSDDGSLEYLSEQPDVSLWRTEASYRNARFGLDWMTWLQIRYAHGRWCLMVDADELLVFAQDDRLDIPALTAQLEARGQTAFGALMLDLYPKEALGAQTYQSGQDPREVLQWFDPEGYRRVRQNPLGNLWVQGGARERAFFEQAPERSPTLNKIPLVKWNRRFAYVNSCHSILPRELNFAYDGPGGDQPSGALLHTKFLPEIVSKSETEKQRGEHFNDPAAFDHYYDTLTSAPCLYHDGSCQYEGPQQLESLGLLTSGWLAEITASG